MSKGSSDTNETRALRRSDRDPIERMLQAEENFSKDEMATALEVIDEALEGDPDYIVRVVEAQGKLAGYECHGPTPLTDGTYDLYWIVVGRASQKLGFGQRLLRAAEDDVRSRGGRLMLIETSSQESYAATIRFYERSGYRLEARVRDFYRAGDDKLVFAKALQQT